VDGCHGDEIQLFSREGIVRKLDLLATEGVLFDRTGSLLDITRLMNETELWLEQGPTDEGNQIHGRADSVTDSTIYHDFLDRIRDISPPKTTESQHDPANDPLLNKVAVQKYDPE